MRYQIQSPPMVNDPMQAVVNANLLRYSAGNHIWCPNCDTILDCHTTVIVSLDGYTGTCCAQCWDKAAARIAQRRGCLPLDVIDGRRYGDML